MPFYSQLHVSDLRCQIRLDASALCLRAEPDRRERTHTPVSQFPFCLRRWWTFTHSPMWKAACSYAVIPAGAGTIVELLSFPLCVPPPALVSPWRREEEERGCWEGGKVRAARRHPQHVAPAAACAPPVPGVSSRCRLSSLQGIILPQILTGVAANLVNALVNYLFLHELHLGVMGSALANLISQFSLALFLFLYIIWKKLHRATWGGWSLECLQDWGSFFRLAIPSMLMLCMEWWAYEIGSFLSGILGMVELGAQSIVYELATMVFMIPTGFSVAASVRIGNALGAGDIAQARRCSVVSVLVTELFAVAFCVLLLSCKDLVGYIFTTDR
ncbi:PREDICTED: multidrug and toxin extrusion protein 1-like [Myotis brandtii]|uniref:multidrug and toxin extrusion protein 1-like n=1 Tax=Myotis brandtii TaxID=109478 RepID=UPI000704490A|nr:PREDICTED: multidrug and toxin extrusion protein 1-like [Myotis brandtii]